MIIVLNQLTTKNEKLMIYYKNAKKYITNVLGIVY